ncbi:uncharacterized protein LOC127799726 [Diospyros lotus]|uniref:uncharacterized protein LOC127799726 n=1 Tax=Diospyros lotus TaxID=55363 RepID=UPI002259A5E7|nr:uncharacterized protein LOC127799726 [Diospyros lotus]
MVQFAAESNPEIDNVVLQNAPQNAQYIAPSIQKEMLHIMANRLTLISAARDVDVIWQFFSHLDNIINIITSSPKRITELQAAQRKEVERMLAIGERESGSGANQVGNLQQSGSTRWSSHYDSTKSLIDMYNATCKVFEYLSVHFLKGRSRAETIGAYKQLKSFDFVFSLHLMHNIMRITDVLCQTLQRKSQDILADSFYKVSPCCFRDQIIVEHHYHFDVFNETIDFILMELNTRFNDTLVELLSLSATLDPRNSFESFNSRDICTLVEKFFPEDFSRQDICDLEYELQHYELDMKSDPCFQVSTLVELCCILFESGRSETYITVIKLFRLILTLPVSTATTERAFSPMKHVKIELHSKMEDDFLSDCMILNIEWELAEKIDLNSIVNEFYVSKSR